QWQERWQQDAAAESPAALDLEAAVRVLDAYPGGALDEAQAKQLFSAFGIPAVREGIAADAEEAQRAAAGLGECVVVKILSNQITHKSDIGGVALNVPAAEVGARVRSMSEQVAKSHGSAPQAFLV